MNEENTETKGEQEVDLMEELLDSADNFDELNDVSDDKANKRRKKAVETKDSPTKTEENKDLAAKRAKLKERQDAARAKRESKKKLKPPKKEGEGADTIILDNAADIATLEDLSDIEDEVQEGNANEEDGDKMGEEGDMEFDTRSEASSDHQFTDDEPSMSEASRASSISRESSGGKEVQEEEKEDRKRKHSLSDTSLKSVEEPPKKPKESSSKKKYDYITKVNYLFRDARFFLMKSNNAENIQISKSKGVWSTPPQNEAKLNQAFREARNVILVFSIKESGRFCGKEWFVLQLIPAIYECQYQDLFFFL
ncbi:YTH domain-containing protein 1-like isoform X1 [Macrobrachium nipponense]|uniref:YTH domain-containing protein 1-like isoform X1 n=1 Tax=Macrobrachium nipponense TaxID=159736 RepID=UPI0030C802A5